MSDHPTGKENLAIFLAWVGSLTLAQWQQVVGIATGALVGVYTLLRIWYLLRGRRERGDE